MSKRFSHPLIEEHAFADIPLNHDIYLVDEQWLDAYEASLLRLLAGKSIPKRLLLTR